MGLVWAQNGTLCVGTDGHSQRSLIRIQSEKYVDCGCTMSGVGKGTEREKCDCGCHYVGRGEGYRE